MFPFNFLCIQRGKCTLVRSRSLTSGLSSFSATKQPPASAMSLFPVEAPETERRRNLIQMSPRYKFKTQISNIIDLTG